MSLLHHSKGIHAPVSYNKINVDLGEESSIFNIVQLELLIRPDQTEVLQLLLEGML